MYIGTNVLMYERWLVLKVRYTAGRPNAFAIPQTHIACACESKITFTECRTPWLGKLTQKKRQLHKGQRLKIQHFLALHTYSLWEISTQNQKLGPYSYRPPAKKTATCWDRQMDRQPERKQMDGHHGQPQYPSLRVKQNKSEEQS